MAASLPVKDKIETGKPVKIAPFKKSIRKTEPHKHNNYFEIIYLSKGKGFHAIDSVKFSVTTPVIYIVRKEQVHHWELSSEPDGFVLILKKAFADTSLDKELKKLLTDASAFSCIPLQNKKNIEQLFILLAGEYELNQANSMLVIEGLLKALLAKILQQAKPLKVVTKKSSDIFLRLLEVLNQERSVTNNVRHYAERLNTTPQNLNAACRKSAGQSAAEVLSGFIIAEAKRLLLYTDMTVAEISLSLDFKDNSHFVKYFKRHTGKTPQSFRLS